MRYELLGVSVDALTADDLLTLIGSAVTRGAKEIIAHHNLHSVYLYHRDEKLRRFYERAAVAHIDGMSLVAWGRLLGSPLARRHRTTYHEFLHALARRAALSDWRVFHLGGTELACRRGCEVLRAEAPGLVIDAMHGYFDVEGPANEAVLRRIREFGTDVLLVGLGMPRQEHWVIDNLDRIAAHAILTVGAGIEWVSGLLPEPPRWMSESGLQWLWRLVTHPRRVYRRYLVEPWALIPLALRDLAEKCRRDPG
jgi:N-acetylglucosaminyldiphosphoundecaprenol N-acetyl-beta-D-mannosaminyltransferase